MIIIEGFLLQILNILFVTFHKNLLNRIETYQAFKFDHFQYNIFAYDFKDQSRF